MQIEGPLASGRVGDMCQKVWGVGAEIGGAVGEEVGAGFLEIEGKELGQAF